MKWEATLRGSNHLPWTITHPKLVRPLLLMKMMDPAFHTYIAPFSLGSYLKILWFIKYYESWDSFFFFMSYFINILNGVTSGKKMQHKRNYKMGFYLKNKSSICNIDF